MPEGDTIFRAAETLRDVLEGQQIISSDSNVDVLSMPSRAEKTVVGVEARGKHLLIHFDDQMVLHSHMGMTGSWHVYQNDEPWKKPQSRAACVLQTDRSTAVCFTPKLIECLSPTELRRHRHLSRLGPDLLSAEFDYDRAIARFRIHNSRPIGEAIMNQTIVCGIGNVYKSEILFLERANPFALVEQYSDDDLDAILRQARKLMLRNRKGHRRVTRVSLQGGRVWVYRRSREKCFECGSLIQMQRQGDLGRSTYWCPQCQQTE